MVWHRLTNNGSGSGSGRIYISSSTLTLTLSWDSKYAMVNGIPTILDAFGNTSCLQMHLEVHSRGDVSAIRFAL